MTTTGYLAAAYLVLLALVLIYFGIMALRLVRIARELASLQQAVREREQKQQESHR